MNMSRQAVRLVIGGCCSMLGIVSPAVSSAQPFESIGIRALAMGGAFVAVADDGTAVYWNPAGLGTGPIFSLVAEAVSADQVVSRDTVARSVRSRFLGLATLPLGLAYYRLVGKAAAIDSSGGNADQGVRALSTDHLGVTVVQSLTDAIVIGSTVKYVRARAASGRAGGASAERALDIALQEGDPRHSWDLDAGVMANFDTFRIGVVARNIREPSAEISGEMIQLARQVRAGLAIIPSDSVIVSFDLDIAEPKGSQSNRQASLGIERRWDHLKLGVRGGIRVDTRNVGTAVYSTGVSVILRSTMYLDAFAAAGGQDAPQSWGVGVRFAY